MNNDLGNMLREQLGIQPGDGVDNDELKAIVKAITKIRILMVGVADIRDTEDTLAILEAMRAVVKSMSTMTPMEATFLLGNMSNMVLPGTSAPAASAALGAGTTPPPTAPQQITSQQALQMILNDASIDQGVRNAMRRIASTGPDQIKVLTDGTPEETSRVRQESTRLQDLLNAALRGAGLAAVAHEAPNALAARVQAAIRPAGAPGVPATMDAAAVKAQLAVIRAVVDAATTSTIRSKVMIGENDFNKLYLPPADPAKRNTPGEGTGALVELEKLFP